MEKDNDVKGARNSYTTPFRQYDPRLGRWLTTDPIVHPWQSPYTAFNDNPIFFVDPSGLEGVDVDVGGTGTSTGTSSGTSAGGESISGGSEGGSTTFDPEGQPLECANCTTLEDMENEPVRLDPKGLPQLETNLPESELSKKPSVANDNIPNSPSDKIIKERMSMDGTIFRWDPGWGIGYGDIDNGGGFHMTSNNPNAFGTSRWSTNKEAVDYQIDVSDGLIPLGSNSGSGVLRNFQVVQNMSKMYTPAIFWTQQVTFMGEKVQDLGGILSPTKSINYDYLYNNFVTQSNEIMGKNPYADWEKSNEFSNGYISGDSVLVVNEVTNDSSSFIIKNGTSKAIPLKKQKK